MRLTPSAVSRHPAQVMIAMTYTAARENLASTMNRICRDRAPVIITRSREEPVVMISFADYEQLEATACTGSRRTNKSRGASTN